MLPGDYYKNRFSGSIAIDTISFEVPIIYHNPTYSHIEYLQDQINYEDDICDVLDNACHNIEMYNCALSNIISVKQELVNSNYKLFKKLVC